MTIEDRVTLAYAGYKVDDERLYTMNLDGELFAEEVTWNEALEYVEQLEKAGA